MKKITALFLALALCLSLCTVTAFATEPITHNLKVWKNAECTEPAHGGNVYDGSDGADYFWSASGGDTCLFIFKGGLTVSGTTTSERIVVMASATNLTINNLKIEHSIMSPLAFNGTATLTLVGVNELKCTGNNAALSFGEYPNPANGTIAGAGNLTASSTGSGGILALGTLTFTQTDTVKAKGTYGIGGMDGVSFNKSIGKIIARGTTIGAVYGAVTLGEALTMTGSPDFDAEEASITGETTIADDNTVKMGGDVPLSVLIKPAHEHTDGDFDWDYETLAKAGLVAAGVVTAVVVTKVVVDKLHEIKAEKAAAAEAAKLAEMPMVKMGDSGDAVTTLQTELNAQGYDCGEVDGVFGQNTLNAVITFQTAKGLTADGIVGELTWAALL